VPIPVWRVAALLRGGSHPPAAGTLLAAQDLLLVHESRRTSLTAGISGLPISASAGAYTGSATRSRWPW